MEPALSKNIPVASDFQVNEQQLGMIHENITTIKFSPDQLHQAYVMHHNGRTYLVADGKEQAVHDKILEESVTFSPNGLQLAYVSQKNKKYSLITYDNIGVEYDRIVPKSIVFSPNSKRIAYVAYKNQKWFAIIDNHESPGCDNIVADGLIFSPDSNRIVYGVLKNNKARIVIDGKEGQEYDEVRKMVFSPDSKRLAFIARRDNKEIVVTDGKESSEYERIESLIFSPNSKILAFTVFNRGINQWFVVVDGKEGPKFENGSSNSILFSPDSKRFTYSVQKNGKWLQVVDGSASPEYSGIVEECIAFSQDSKHIAYGAGRDDRNFLVIDGNKSDKYDGVTGVVFSPDSARVAYLTFNGSMWRLKLDENIGTAYSMITRPVFSPDSSWIAYGAMRGDKWVLVANNQGIAEFDQLVMPFGPVFDSDGKLISIINRKGVFSKITVHRRPANEKNHSILVNKYKEGGHQLFEFEVFTMPEYQAVVQNAPPCRIRICIKDNETLILNGGGGYWQMDYVYSLGENGKFTWPKLMKEPTLKGHGSRYILVGGKHILANNKYELFSDPSYPLLFYLCRNKGLVYLSGKGNVKFENEAVFNLGKDHNVERMLSLLNSDDVLVREGAAWALGWLPKNVDETRKAQTELIEHLCDHVYVKITAIESLGRIGSSDIIPELEKCLEEWPGYNSSTKDYDDVFTQIEPAIRTAILFIERRKTEHISEQLCEENRGL